MVESSLIFQCGILVFAGIAAIFALTTAVQSRHRKDSVSDAVDGKPTGYEDEDGSASKEAQEDYDRVYKPHVLLILASVGAGGSLARSVIDTLKLRSDVGDWLGFGTWVRRLLEVVGSCADIDASFVSYGAVSFC